MREHFVVCRTRFWSRLCFCVIFATTMTRKLEHPADSQFIHRTSPRAMSGEALTREDLLPLFEAARWAPSCANSQPWRFVYALAGTPAFDAFFATLAPGNQAWCKRAGALVLTCANTIMSNGSPSPTPAFDAGAAWMSFALQASLSGLVVHGMAGFDSAKGREVAHVPEDHQVIMMIAVGRPGKIDDLPEAYRAREEPTPRQSVEWFLREGSF
jgi:nitroreductase